VAQFFVKGSRLKLFHLRPSEEVASQLGRCSWLAMKAPIASIPEDETIEVGLGGCPPGRHINIGDVHPNKKNHKPATSLRVDDPDAHPFLDKKMLEAADAEVEEAA